MVRRSAGFTLIEILVVLVIIAMLVSMATLNTSYDGRYDDLKNQSEKIKFQLMSVAEVALFENKNLGVVFSKTEFEFYVYKPQPEPDPNSTNTVVEKKDPWQPYPMDNIKLVPLEEGTTFSLEIEGQSVSLPYSLEQDEEAIEPNVFLFASGEQTPMTLKLSIEDFDAYSQVRSSGLGQFYSELIREEQ